MNTSTFNSKYLSKKVSGSQHSAGFWEKITGVPSTTPTHLYNPCLSRNRWAILLRCSASGQYTYWPMRETIAVITRSVKLKTDPVEYPWNLATLPIDMPFPQQPRRFKATANWIQTFSCPQKDALWKIGWSSIFDNNRRKATWSIRTICLKSPSGKDQNISFQPSHLGTGHLEYK